MALSESSGYGIIAGSVLFFLLASYATLFSAVLPLTGLYALDAIAQDKHYKYFILLAIPTTAYFIIVNWVGWQYYQNS
ncbi:hypothetical protein CONPUDRAFT_48163 [Coniophora puteana RWD-64-598 SS2]|uniref:Uncharacterized protein n=1 Tax=Coniophora puteana (strain RWD-64-598) TaxID=741705 RepID=A0A5M3N188_CONPW|nr:uncharacterized protein CONPUDRAFT_48163 [Coniophora puteana RWD-64-598 SS2]EIW85066.1 hypothetical protein CONPUDRAFT_48163 [Coniophora puteana RWD-64-598 SS2]